VEVEEEGVRGRVNARGNDGVGKSGRERGNLNKRAITAVGTPTAVIALENRKKIILKVVRGYNGDWSPTTVVVAPRVQIF